jgi:hypothetical protein
MNPIAITFKDISTVNRAVNMISEAPNILFRLESGFVSNGSSNAMKPQFTKMRRMIKLLKGFEETALIQAFLRQFVGENINRLVFVYSV